MKMRETSRGQDKKLADNNNLKTAILAKRLTAKFGVQTLFVANKKSLLDDAKEEFLDGIVGLDVNDVGEIKDGVFGNMRITGDTQLLDVKPLDQKIIVATIQSLDAKLKDPRTSANLIQWLKNVEFLMVVSKVCRFA